MKKILLALAMLLMASSAFATYSYVPMEHFVNGTHVDLGTGVPTDNSFEYKVVLTNDTNEAKTVNADERLGKLLDLESANFTFNKTGEFFGMYTYEFEDITVPAYGTVEIKMQIKNNTGTDQTALSVFVQNWDDPRPGYWGATIFYYRNLASAIPEFPLAIIPIGIVLGSFFVISRKKLN